MDGTVEVDPAVDVEDANVMVEKIINEEYKIWKKNAPFLYDKFFSRALDWPSLTVQWFPDKKSVPEENSTTHRLLIGTHTDDAAPNYLEIVHLSLANSVTPDPEDYNGETGEIGGYGANKKGPEPVKFDIVQKIDHEGEVNKARYMPQNPDIIATMCANAKISIFDRTKHPSQPTGTVNPQIELTGHTKEGYGVHWNPSKEGQIVTGSEDQTVKLWDIQGFSKSSKTLKPLRSFTHHNAVVNDVEFHPAMEWMVATVSDDLSLQILDLRKDDNTRAAKSVPNAHADAINNVSFNPGIEYILATGSADKSIGIWDIRNLKMKLHACEGHRDVVSQVEWHPKHKAVLASSGYDRRVIMWDLNKVGEEQTPEDAEDGPPEMLFMHGGHTNRVSDFSFNKNDPWLMCSTAEDNLIHVWQTAAAIVGRDNADVAMEELEA